MLLLSGRSDIDIDNFQSTTSACSELHISSSAKPWCKSCTARKLCSDPFHIHHLLIAVTVEPGQKWKLQVLDDCWQILS